MSQVTSAHQPLVSVIVITYNSGQFVLETLDSIRDQTYGNIELIISDDASADDTVKVCEVWLKTNSSRFIATKIIKAEKNSGISPNCNRGVKAATGDWVKIIAGDDALEPQIIQQYIDFATANPQAMCMYSNVAEYEGTFAQENRLPVIDLRQKKMNAADCGPKEQFEYLLRGNPVWAATLIVKREVLIEVGGFNERYPFFEDRPLLLALTKAGYKIFYLDTVGAKYRRHTASIQFRKSNVFMSALRKSQEEFFIREYLWAFTKREQSGMLFRNRKNRFLTKLSGNRKNLLVQVLSNLLEFYPKIVLKRNRA